MSTGTKTALFDLGGVLTYVDWSKPSNLLASDSDKLPSIGLDVFQGTVVQSFMRGLLNPRQFHRAFCDSVGLDLAYDEFVTIWKSPFTPNDAIVPLVRMLGEKHDLAIVSNTDPLDNQRLYSPG